MTDAEPRCGVQAGDLAAWEQIYVRCLPTVLRYVYLRAGGDRQLAEDVVSETFLALVRQVSSLTPRDGDLSAWLIAVAKQARRPAAKSGPCGGGGGQHPRWQYFAAGRRRSRRGIGNGRNSPARYCRDGLSAGRGAVGVGVEVRSTAFRSSISPAASGGTEKAVESVLYRARRSFREHFQRLFGTCP